VQVAILRSAHFYPWENKKIKEKKLSNAILCIAPKSSCPYCLILLNTFQQNKTTGHDIDFSILQSGGSNLTPV
jgi:hypothetical protein